MCQNESNPRNQKDRALPIGITLGILLMCALVFLSVQTKSTSQASMMMLVIPTADFYDVDGFDDDQTELDIILTDNSTVEEEPVSSSEASRRILEKALILHDEDGNVVIVQIKQMFGTFALRFFSAISEEEETDSETIPEAANQEPEEKVEQKSEPEAKEEKKDSLPPLTWDGPKLTKRAGVVQGPNGRETFYNLKMSGVIRLMRELGYSEDEYPYWVRDDGCKMFGPYIMVAANLKTRPKGTIIETSLGWAMVCDTGDFVKKYPNGIDIAVNWVVQYHIVSFTEPEKLIFLWLGSLY